MKACSRAAVSWMGTIRVVRTEGRTYVGYGEGSSVGSSTCDFYLALNRECVS